jgi:hypothetical protein
MKTFFLLKPHTNSSGIWGFRNVTERKRTNAISEHVIVDQNWVDLTKYKYGKKFGEYDDRWVKICVSKLKSKIKKRKTKRNYTGRKSPMTIKEYRKILSKCKFIALPDTWYVEGSVAKLDGTPFVDYNSDDIKFNDNCGLFDGWTNEVYDGYIGVLPREDSETCSFDEFQIIDEYGNDITELTLKDYKLLLRKLKMEKLQLK